MSEESREMTKDEIRAEPIKRSLERVKRDFALYWDRALMTDEEREEHDRLEMERTERFKKLFPASDMTQEVLYKNSKMENKNQ